MSQEFIITRRIIYYALDLVEAVLVIRFILKAFNANGASGFVQFIYSLSGPLIAPFSGILPTIAQQGITFELTTIIAIIVYAIVGQLLIRLFRLILNSTLPNTHIQ